MGLEIERKFLVDHEKWSKVPKAGGRLHRQGYMVKDERTTIRVRLADTEAYLTIKGVPKGPVRKEFEYPIPVQDAKVLLEEFTGSAVTKVRYEIEFDNKIWEVDEFHDENEGLIIAEIELEDESENFTVPDWVTTEVTNDERYYNASLSVNPYKSWPLQ